MIAKLEQFVYRLSEDHDFREMASRNPEAAIATYGLTGPERQGALKLCAQVAGINTPRPNGWWI